MSGTPRLFSTLSRQAGSPDRLGLITVGVVLATLSFMAITAWPLVKTWTAKPDVAFAPADESARKTLKNKFDSTLAGAADTIDKRWPFAPERIIVAVQPPTRVPPKYLGTELVGMVGDTAIFRDGKLRKVGGEAVDGVAVLSIDPPWTARVRWSGGDYTVSLFERNNNVLVGGPDIFRPGPVGSFSTMNTSATRGPQPAPGPGQTQPVMVGAALGAPPAAQTVTSAPAVMQLQGVPMQIEGSRTIVTPDGGVMTFTVVPTPAPAPGEQPPTPPPPAPPAEPPPKQ